MIGFRARGLNVYFALSHTVHITVAPLIVLDITETLEASCRPYLSILTVCLP